MTVEKQLVAEKGKYRLYKVGAFYEIWSLTNFARSGKQWVMETSFNDQSKAYSQFTLLTKTEK
jgi:hypothetical protein